MVANKPAPDMLEKHVSSSVNEVSPAINFNVNFSKMVLGVFALLIACIVLFDGPMVPAMWQLTSVIWCIWRFFKT